MSESMSRDAEMDSYRQKSAESLASAGSDFASRRYNSCANRAYFSCFQAAVVALLQAGIESSREGEWPHSFVQAQFAGQLVVRRKRYPANLRDILPRLMALRHTADYDMDQVSQAQAERALRRARAFLTAVQGGRERQ